jgi:hypothetical protein
MSNTSRLTYLTSVGLNHDPFATPVAEQETSSVEDIPVFYSYYLQPAFFTGNQELSEKDLRQSEKNFFIYGEPGDGKTTLRLAIEAECRTRVEKTLVVSYLLGEDLKNPLTLEEHGDRLAKAIAIDLFIQIVEQYDLFETPPNKKLIEALRKQVALGGRHISRLMRLILDNSMPNARAGIGAYWQTVGKAAVKYVPKTEDVVKLLQNCLDDPAERSVLTGWDLVQQGIHAARLWGFKRLLVMVDGVDTRHRTIKDMLALIKPLFGKLPGLAAQDIYFRFFLPTELQAKIEQVLGASRLPNYLYMPIIIKWREDALRRLLAQRFFAAGSHLQGFEALAERNLDIDDKLVTAANGSPRRLLRLASDLVDVHVARRGPGDLRISQSDWDKIQNLTQRD